MRHLVCLVIMAANEDFGKFLVGLAGEISNEVKRSLQDVGGGFTKPFSKFINCHQYSRDITGSRGFWRWSFQI